MVFREEPVVMALRVAGWLEVAVATAMTSAVTAVTELLNCGQGPQPI